MKGRYVGIDLGKRSMVVCFMNENQKQLSMRNFGTSEKRRKQLFRHLGKDDVVGIEAGSLTFSLVKEIISEVGATVHILHPAKLHFIFKSVKKTDSEDARKIARHIATNAPETLYTVNLPSDREIENRAIAHESRYLTKARTQQINRLHSVFVRQGITDLKRSDLKSKDGRERSIQQLTGFNVDEAMRLHRHISEYEEDIELLEKQMKERLSGNEHAQFILSIPGVAVKTAFAFLSYIGDGSRFTSGTEVTNYVGMVPRIDFSGDTEIMGHIHKRGPSILRAFFVQAAWSLVRSKDGGELKEKYKEISSRRGKRIAIVAIARKMLALSWLLMHNSEFYKYGTLEGRLKKLKHYGIFLGEGVLTN